MSTILAAALLLLQQAPDPELERMTFKLAPGLEVSLFAADPLVAKPIQMNWDSRGRLWIATSSTYPQVLPGELPNDRIVILEDTDGDGRADKSSVFAEGLFIPTGIEPGDGGCYVANATELLHLADTDGDGKADRSRVLLSGFGTEDTHHIIHTFRWGPDGLFYFNQSIYIHSHVETPHGVRRLGGGGIWRFRPATLELDVFVKGMCNPWGHAFDRWGNSFGTDGAGGDGIHYLVPGFTYPHYPGGEKHFPGLNPGQPKYCANETVSGRHFPDDWQGHQVTNDFRANRIVRFAISDDGSGFASKPAGEVLSSTDRAFRPVDIRMGPDGALYVADWYNPIINHGEVGFRDPRRDRTHGRIWRISVKDRPALERPRLHDGTPVAALLDHLKAPEGWTRQYARRALVERGVGRAVLDAWTAATEDDATGLEALWTYQSLDWVEPALLAKLLSSPSGDVRAAAVRVAGRWRARLPNPLALLEKAVADGHPRVRLEAVRALAEFRDERAIEIVMRVLEKPMDRFLEHAVWLAANELKSAWLPAFQAGRIAFGGNKAQTDAALQAVKSPLALAALVNQVKAGWQSQETRLRALDLLAATAGPAEAQALLAANFPAGMQDRVLAALRRGALEREVRPAPAELPKLKRFFVHDSPAVVDEALLLAGAWKIEALRKDLERHALEGRRPAVDAVAMLGGPASASFLESMAAATNPLPLRQLGVIGLAALDLPRAAALAPEVLQGDCTAVYAAFLARRGGAEALDAALEGRPPAPDAARLGLRAMYAAGLQVPALRERLNRAVGLTPRAAELTPEALAAWSARVRTEGDPVRGEEIFRRKELSCFQCHAIGGAGAQVGPDFQSLGASAPVDYLVESILKPDAKQKEGYVSMRVLTKAGDVLSGVRVRENDRELVLRDAIRDEIVIPKDRIEMHRESASIMPAGLADLLTDGEFLDLVRFLSELGKPPFAVTAAPAIRRWRTPAGEPVYSRVSGDLPASATAVEGEIHVVTPGSVRFRLNTAAGLKLWLDGKPVEAKERFDVELALGLHVLRVEVADAGARGGAPLRVEVEETPGSPARVHVVGGR
jgi:putative heme-binding domain-containing protein